MSTLVDYVDSVNRSWLWVSDCISSHNLLAYCSVVLCCDFRKPENDALHYSLLVGQINSRWWTIINQFVEISANKWKYQSAWISFVSSKPLYRCTQLIWFRGRVWFMSIVCDVRLYHWRSTAVATHTDRRYLLGRPSVVSCQSVRLSSWAINECCCVFIGWLSSSLSSITPFDNNRCSAGRVMHS